MHRGQVWNKAEARDLKVSSEVLFRLECNESNRIELNNFRGVRGQLTKKTAGSYWCALTRVILLVITSTIRAESLTK